MKYVLLTYCPNNGKTKEVERLLQYLTDGWEIFNTEHNRDMIVYILRKKS